MTTDTETLAEAAFRQLYDHSLAWDGGGSWLDDDIEAIATERANAAGLAGDWLPWGITKAAVIARGAELLLEEQVLIARCDGATWREIALCMGIHPSAAHRWAKRRNIEERATEKREAQRKWMREHHGTR